MFEHFTFGAQAQPLQLDDIADSCSPTDCSFPLHLAPTSYFPMSTTPGLKGMSEIVDAFSQHTLYHDDAPTCSIWSARLPSPESDFSNLSSTDEEDEEEILNQMSYMSTTRGMTTVQSSVSSTKSLPSLPPPRTTSGTVACRRLQRQLNVQLQSCNSHVKDINSLVSDMITTNSQCRLHTSKSRSNSSLSTPPPSGLVPSSPRDLVVDTLDDDYESNDLPMVEDEGFAEMDDNEFALSVLEEEMSLRRASAPSGIRKYNVVRWRKTTESISGNGSTVARTKVKSVPRMRKRKVETVSE